jgi:TolB-like protein
MEEILKEQGFQQSGCTSSECALEAGQLLNVEQMVTGSISKVGEIYSVEVRLIDVESGKIVAVGVEDIRGGIEDVLTSGMNKVVWDMLR